VIGLGYSFYIHSFVHLYYVAIVLLTTITKYKQNQWMFCQKMWQEGDGQSVMAKRPTLQVKLLTVKQNQHAGADSAICLLTGLQYLIVGYCQDTLPSFLYETQ
jgi:hypothetical protein